MEPLDFRKFVWSRGTEWFNVLVVTTYNDEGVVVYQNTNYPNEIKVVSFDAFCREFTPTYDLI